MPGMTRTAADLTTDELCEIAVTALTSAEVTEAMAREKVANMRSEFHNPNLLRSKLSEAAMVFLHEMMMRGELALRTTTFVGVTNVATLDAEVVAFVTRNRVAA